MKVVVQLQRTKAHLPELSITGVPGECCSDRQGPVGRQASALFYAVHHHRWAGQTSPAKQRLPDQQAPHACCGHVCLGSRTSTLQVMPDEGFSSQPTLMWCCA